jgi:hypothetical protein
MQPQSTEGEYQNVRMQVRDGARCSCVLMGTVGCCLRWGAVRWALSSKILEAVKGNDM